jgi:hypothetical protein
MLSTQECRDLIPDSEEMDDSQIEEIRHTLYGLADIAFDMWMGKKSE